MSSIDIQKSNLLKKIQALKSANNIITSQASSSPISNKGKLQKVSSKQIKKPGSRIKSSSNRRSGCKGCSRQKT